MRPKGPANHKAVLADLGPEVHANPVLDRVQSDVEIDVAFRLELLADQTAQECVRLAGEANLFGAKNERLHCVPRVVISVRSRSLSRSLLAGSALSPGVAPMRPMRRSSRPTRSQ